MDDTPKEPPKKQNTLLKYLDTKSIVLIIITIVFWWYLINSVQLVSNTQMICKPFYNITGCNGNLTGGKCCEPGLIYTMADDVPKHTISWGKGFMFLGVILLTMYSILNLTMGSKFLNYSAARKVLYNHYKREMPEYKIIEIGRVAKCRYYHNTKEPFTWVLSITAKNPKGLTKYFQGEVQAYWRSSDLEDHFKANKLRSEPLTATYEIDKEEIADIYKVPCRRCMDEKDTGLYKKVENK